MKNTLIIILNILGIWGYSQSKYPKIVNNHYEPRELRYILSEEIPDTSNFKPYSHIITYNNFRYTYDVFEDTRNINVQLIKKEKLYYDAIKALKVTIFITGSLIILEQGAVNIPMDKKLHYIAGYAISTGSGLLVYEKTKNTWLATGISLLSGCLAGIIKESIVDKYTNGVVSNEDAYYTIGGAFTSAIQVKLTLHK